ncbi:MAG TPA: FIST C-terminal domain-containing protein [Polyangiaceae bacterium]
MGLAASFATSTSSSIKVVRTIENAAAQVRNPCAALVFLSGTVGEKLEEVASAVADRKLGFPVLFGTGAGVLHERGELEGQSAAAGLVWSGVGARALVLHTSHGDLASALDRALSEHRARSAFLLVRPDRLEPGLFADVSLKDRVVFGAGTATSEDVVVTDGRGGIDRGPVGALLVETPPILGVTRASRLITPLRPITRISGSMILEIDGEDALDVLSAAGQQLGGQPLIFVALANDDQPESGATSRSPEVVLRPIQGVDPTRRGIVVGDNVEESTLAAFAIRDAPAAREDLESMTRELLRHSAGAAPRFGVYVNCAGRGRSLYSATNVDTRLIRSRLGDVPLVGLQSAFELAPYAGGLALHLYTGVLALFTSPS